MTDDQHRYARMIAALLQALGPRPRARLELTLRALGLSGEDAQAVIALGLVHGLFEVDPTAPEILRAPPAS